VNFSFFTLRVFRVCFTISQHTRFDDRATEQLRRCGFGTNNSREIRHRKALLDTSQFHENVFAGIGEEANDALGSKKKTNSHQWSL
jgi:hypothetical protein